MNGGGRHLARGQVLQIAVCRDESLHDALGLLRADARQQLEQSQPGDDVAGVLGQPQERHQVLDVGRLGELEPAVLVEGDLLPGQLHLHGQAVVRRPKEDGLLFQGNARLAMPEDLLDDVAGLGVLVGTGDQPGRFSFRPARMQVLAVALRRLGDHRLVTVRIGSVLR